MKNEEVYREEDSYKQCPHCMRKFNDHAAERHIPVCGKKAKVNAMKNTTQVILKTFSGNSTVKVYLEYHSYEWY